MSVIYLLVLLIPLGILTVSITRAGSRSWKDLPVSNAEAVIASQTVVVDPEPASEPAAPTAVRRPLAPRSVL